MGKTRFWCVHQAYNQRNCMFTDWHYDATEAETEFIKGTSHYGILYKEEPEPGILPLDVLGPQFTLNHPETQPLPATKVEREEAKARNIAKLETPVQKLTFKEREPNPEQLMKAAVKAEAGGFEDNNGQPFRDMKQAKMAVGRAARKKDGKGRSVVRNPNGPGFLIKVT